MIQLDPTLLASGDYLAPYPALAAFVAEHPEVAHDPDFFVGQFRDYDGPPRTQAWDFVKDFTQMTGLLTVFFVVASVLVWLLKTVLELRRWLRLTKLQAEVHGKLLDRFTASDELIAYIKIALRAAVPRRRAIGARSAGRAHERAIQPHPLVAPGRIRPRVRRRRIALRQPADHAREINQFVSVIGVVVLAIGIGFTLSAAGAWLLSKRLGLLSREGRPGDDATAFGPVA